MIAHRLLFGRSVALNWRILWSRIIVSSAWIAVLFLLSIAWAQDPTLAPAPNAATPDQNATADRALPQTRAGQEREIEVGNPRRTS